MTNDPRFGAMPEEWAHFSERLGLTEDLLPVVINPKARISPLSKMKGLGKTPSMYNRERNVRGFADWTAYRADADDIARWSAEPDYGICVQTRRCRAIDIDIDEPERALEVAMFVTRDLGMPAYSVPVRFRFNSGRLVIPVDVEGDIAKSVVRVNGGAIELLGTGQQFVAAGTHSSGERYLWSTLQDLLDARVGLA